MLLASLLSPQEDWDKLDQRAALGLSKNRYPSMQFPNRGKISNTLTLPGKCTSKEWLYATIYDQDASMNGWTCGNVISNTKDLAQFWVDLLDEEAKDALVSDTLRKEMCRYEKETQGTLPGSSYGAGLQIGHAGRHHGHRIVNVSDPAFFWGHNGDTYGFLAEGGFLPVFKAGFQVVLNRDYFGPTMTATSCLVQIAGEVLHGQKLDLGCTYAQRQGETSLLV